MGSTKQTKPALETGEIGVSYPQGAQSQHRGANPQERWVLSLTRCPFSLLDLPMRFTNDCRLNMRGGCKPMERVNTMANPTSEVTADIHVVKTWPRPTL